MIPYFTFFSSVFVPLARLIFYSDQAKEAEMPPQLIILLSPGIAQESHCAIYIVLEDQYLTRDQSSS